VRKLKLKVLLNIVLTLCILYIPTVSFALSGAPVTEADITVTTIPRNPEPYQDVTIKLNSYAMDLNKAEIEWKDKTGVLLSGYGEISYSFTTGGPNTQSVFSITIYSQEDGIAITKNIVITSSELDIFWESIDGYTPPFYKGKSFIAPEGVMRVVAIPNTTKGDKGDITYTWKRDGSTIQNVSGYNKNSYTFKNSQFNKTEKIEISASSVNSRYNATKNIEISTIDPKIIFYKKSPTEGVLYNQALLNESFMKEDEMTIVAVPYFFSLNGYNPSELSYSWKINGEKIKTPSKNSEITIRPSSRGGSATISLVLENLSLLFQKINNTLKLTL
jgi:hypothetical protein